MVVDQLPPNASVMRDALIWATAVLTTILLAQVHSHRLLT